MDIGDAPQPNYPLGDTKLVLGGSRVHQLDSFRLRFAASIGHAERREEGLPDGEVLELLHRDNAAVLDYAARRRGVTTKYHVVLTEMNEENGKFTPTFELVELDSAGRPTGIVPRPALGSEFGGLPVPIVYDVFTAILGAVYQKPIVLGSMDINDPLEFATHLLDLADVLGVKYFLKEHIEKPLKVDIEFTDVQFFIKAIADDPIPWLEIACRLRSRKIYEEAFIHAVGQLKTARVQDNITTLAPEIRQKLEAKAKHIKSRVYNMVKHVQSYYPKELERESTAGVIDAENIGRNSYSNDIFGWMALGLFRHFIAQATLEIGDSVDLGFEFVQSISKGRDAYLTKDDQEAWHQKFPMTPKGKNVLESWLSEVKIAIKPLAQPLLKSKSKLVPGVAKYFTCVEVKEEDHVFKEFKLTIEQQLM